MEQFYAMLLSREAPEKQELDRKKTAQMLKGVRSHKDKATKLRKAVIDKWKEIFEREGYVFDSKKHFGRDVAVKVFPQKVLSTQTGFEKESKFIGWPNPHIMPIFAKATSKNGISVVVMPYIDLTFTASPERVIAPQVYALAGRSIYGGVGIGTYYSDGEYSQGPFFVFRIGYDMELIPSLHADIHANYRFDDWDMSVVEKDIDTDTITLGVAVRFSL